MSRINRPAVPASLGAREVMTADSLEASLKAIDLDAILTDVAGSTDPAAIKRFIEESAAARAQIVHLAARFAADETYRPLFEWILDRTLRRPVILSGLGPVKTEYADRREGANGFVWELVTAIAEGREELPPLRET